MGTSGQLQPSRLKMVGGRAPRISRTLGAHTYTHTHIYQRRRNRISVILSSLSLIASSAPSYDGADCTLSSSPISRFTRNEPSPYLTSNHPVVCPDCRILRRDGRHPGGTSVLNRGREEITSDINRLHTHTRDTCTQSIHTIITKISSTILLTTH